MAGAFKLWLRSLTNDPIIPYECFDEALDIVRKYHVTFIQADLPTPRSEKMSSNEDLSTLQAFIRRLPQDNFAVLERIIRFLRILTLKRCVQYLNFLH